MTNTVYTDRTRIVDFRRCPRKRWYTTEMESGGDARGISPSAPNFDIEMGSAFHKAMEVILNWYIDPSLNFGAYPVAHFLSWLVEFQAGQNNYGGSYLDLAVSAGLAEFDKEIRPWIDAQLMPSSEIDEEEPGDFPIGGLAEGADSLYAYQEAKALTEAMIRIYALAPTGLRFLLDTYEILAVEQEVSVPLAENLVLMGRPDAIIKDRHSGHFFTLSYKTTKTWDQRKDQSQRWDDQGISETIVAEHWLIETLGLESPRAMGVQYIDVLKGEKRKDKDDGNQYKYANSMIRPYTKRVVNDTLFSLEYVSHWKRMNMWETSLGVKGWIEAIANQTVELRDFPNGYDEKHPFDKFIVNPVYFRNDDDLREWQEEVVYQERQVRSHRTVMESPTHTQPKEAELLNWWFPKHRHSCTYPVQCEFKGICHEGVDPLGSGLFRPRTANHPQELIQIETLEETECARK